ncbi:MAG: General stress protein 69 [Candidatus Heimdallarchaeota archaeon AB_125]|nr:MAG: General stress protein 69 [Candidatus Heimdallarchaeota archaeon AB_125]
MIPKIQFGRTGHSSSRIIFGAYALSNATQEEADEVLKVLLEYGINHIDTARIYGKSEERIGPWMERHRDDFFLATKTRSRQYEGAWKDLETSLNMLKVDTIDLWQMHALTNPQGWEKAMGSEGTLKAFLEARESGHVRFLGVTGHGSKVPKVHLQSLERFDFDSVLLPYNYPDMQNPKYEKNFKDLVKLCSERNVALQTIKSVAGRPWEGQPRNYNTYFYEPLVTQEAIDKAVHWAYALENSFLISAGDMKILPKVLEAANRFKKRPTDTEMNKFIEKYGVTSIFSY